MQRPSSTGFPPLTPPSRSQVPHAQRPVPPRLSQQLSVALQSSRKSSAANAPANRRAKTAGKKLPWTALRQRPSSLAAPAAFSVLAAEAPPRRAARRARMQPLSSPPLMQALAEPLAPWMRTSRHRCRRCCHHSRCTLQQHAVQKAWETSVLAAAPMQCRELGESVVADAPAKRSKRSCCARRVA